GAAVTSQTPLSVSNSAPSITQVDIVGTPSINQVLTASYTGNFKDPDGDADASAFQWNRITTTGTTALGTAKDYTLVKADIGASITVTVTPKDNYNGVGTAVTSAAVVPVNLPPVLDANTLSVVMLNAPNGDKPGSQLGTSNFTVADPEGDPLGASTYRWLRNGAAIAKATQSNYVLTLDDTGKSISVEVTPTATQGAKIGSAVVSKNVIAVPSLTAITLSPASVSVEKGQTTVPLTATGTFSDNNSFSLSNGQLLWATDAPAIATVTQAGAVTGQAGGSASITAAYNNLITSNKVALTVLTHSISGTVSGAIAAGVTVTLKGTATTSVVTDTSGNYSFAGLVNGGYTVTPTKTGYMFNPPGVNVTINSANVGAVNIISSTTKINDTGITASLCYEKGSDVIVSCTSTSTPTNPNAGALTLNPAQDGMVGRDASAATNSNADGKLGFSFTKVCNNGQLAGSGTCLATAALGNNLTDWGCTLDNVTGLMWEVKTTGGGLRDWVKTYTNYDSTTALQKYDRATYTFVAPTQAEIDSATNSVGFKNAVNVSGLCGFNDWRLPTADELQSIVDYAVASPGPTIDTAWFSNTFGYLNWSASPAVGKAGSAWGVAFQLGDVNTYSRDSNSFARLVRTGR
ncbi:MAG: DUF1566 domain-containing protein, partial [Gammaproteobacteria bacterium]|nr:DUF1566 domain-containing protein [Gammaproteobacteria bacterium]